MLGEDERLLGVATDGRLLEAVRRGDRDLARAIGDEFHVVEPGTVVGDFMHLAGRQVVPVTVVDERGAARGCRAPGHDPLVPVARPGGPP